MSRVYVPPGRRCGVGVGSSALGQAFRSESLPGGGWRPRRALLSERWAEEVVERAFVLLVDLPVGDRSVLPARCFLDFWAGP